MDDAAADTSASDNLARRFADLRIIGVLSDADDSALAVEGVEHRATFLVGDSNGEQRLAVYHRTEEDDYLVQGDRVTGTFILAAYIAEQMVIESQDLLAEVEEVAADSPLPE